MSTKQPPTSSQRSEVGDYLAVIRARKWTLIRVLVATFALTSVFTYRQHPTYQATAEVLLTVTDTSAAGTGANNNVVGNLTTEKLLVASPAIADPVIKKLGLSVSSTSLTKGVKVSIATGATVLNITYSDHSPELAAKIANGFADAYVTYRTSQAQETFAKATTDLTAQAASLQSRIDSINKQVALAGSPGAKTALLHQVTELTTEQKIVQAQLAVETAPSQSPPRVIRPAAVPSHQVSPSWSHNLLAAAAAGLALGLILAFAGDALDDKIKSRGELQVVTGVPSLGEIPWVGGWAAHRDPGVHLIRGEIQGGGADEALSALATNVRFLASKGRAQVLMVTSTEPGEGKSTVAANLALRLAGLDRSVCLVDMSFGAPVLHTIFGLEGQIGLSSALLGLVPLGDASQLTLIPNLRLISGSPTEADAGKLAAAFGGGTYIDQLRASFDFVIIDTPAMHGSKVATAIAPAVDGTLVVVNPVHLSTSDLRAGMERLRTAGGTIIGTIQNGARAPELVGEGAVR
ncbi:MAG: tyrosine-protein kinase [Actinomycetota bacterium]|nr:tyrosine-protein kinase [Actinomycetota bacterium]